MFKIKKGELLNFNQPTFRHSLGFIFLNHTLLPGRMKIKNWPLMASQIRLLTSNAKNAMCIWGAA